MQIKATFAVSTIRRIKARNHQIGLIHEAKNQLGLSEAAYRDAIAAASHAQTRTSAELDARGRQRALRAFREMGYVEGASRSPSAQKRREARLGDLADIHRAQRGLGLSDPAYRALVATASGGKSRSCADLNARERAQVKKALSARGFDFAPA